jgi:hypothetical protein
VCFHSCLAWPIQTTCLFAQRLLFQLLIMTFRIHWHGQRLDNGSSHRSCTTVTAEIKLIMIHMTCILKSTRPLLLPLFFSSVTIANVTHSQPPRLLSTGSVEFSRNGGTTPTPYFACESSATQSAMRPSPPHPGHPRRETSRFPISGCGCRR